MKITNLFGNRNGTFYGSKIDDSCELISDNAVKTRDYIYIESYLPRNKKYEYYRHRIIGRGICADKAEILDYIPKWFK